MEIVIYLKQTEFFQNVETILSLFRHPKAVIFNRCSAEN